MRTLLNLIWFFLGGLWLGLTYILVGILLCIPIVTIPFAVVSFRIANYAFWPFGREIVAKPGAGAGSVIGNIVWLLVAGLPIVISHVTTAAAQAVTIVGLPLALANLKMIPITLFPFGKQIVDVNAVPAGYTPVHAIQP